MLKKKENIYCLVCRKKPDNKKIRAVALVNKTATQRSLFTVCTFCRLYKQKLIYCLGCKKHTDNIFPREAIMMTNKKKLKENQDVLIVWLTNSFLIK